MLIKVLTNSLNSFTKYTHSSFVKYSENVHYCSNIVSYHTPTSISLSCLTVLHSKQCYYFSLVLSVQPINLVTL